MPRARYDKALLITTLVLLGFGLLIFTSASLSLFTQVRHSFTYTVGKQFAIAILGVIGMFIAMRIPYRTWKRFAIPIFAASVIATLLVFVPHLGIRAGGARRWILLGPLSFQPAEFLKFGFVVYFAAWLSQHRSSLPSFQDGILPMLAIYAIPAAILLIQPNTGILVVLGATTLIMFWIAGGRTRHVITLVLVGMIALGVLAYYRPYIGDRLLTYLMPWRVNPLKEGYQMRQALIAIGTGGITGRGFGKSLQKFHYLPEPRGDSIFAVFAEEFGLIGTLLLIALFITFAFFGMRAAARSPDAFGGLLGAGIVILILIQSFLNMLAMVGLAPLSGIPILFVSQGGSALLFALFEVGVLLNISKYHH